MTSNSQRRSPGSILREVKFILLLPSNWRVETMREGDHESADCCRMGEVEGVGTVELVCVGRLLRMGCDSFAMPLCGSVGSGEPGSRMGYHGNILLRTSGGRRGRNRKPNSVGGKGEAETESLILWLLVLRLLAGGWWWHEAQSLIQGLLETYFVYQDLSTSVWGWVRLPDWIKETYFVVIFTLVKIYF